MHSKSTSNTVSTVFRASLKTHAGMMLLLLIGMVAVDCSGRKKLLSAREGTFELRGIQQYYRIYGSGPLSVPQKLDR